MEYMGPTQNSSPIDRTGGGFGDFNQMNDSKPFKPNFDPNRFRNANNTTNNTQAPILLGLGGTLLFIAICLLAARLWSRIRPAYHLKLDDWTVLAATVLAIVNYFLLSVSVVYGLGRRARFVSIARRRTSLRLTFISQVFWYWSITLVKLSVALLLLRLKHTRPWRIFLYVLMTIIMIAAIVQTVFQFTQCRPFSVYWDPRVFRTHTVRCFERSIITGNIVAFSSVQVALDLIFSFIPITFIRKLNRPRREKIFMCVLMGLGLFASCAAIARTLTLQGFYTSPDVFRTNVTIALWAILELQFAIIAATMPTLKAFMEATLVRIGRFFYDEDSEEEVRSKLVMFGLLGEKDLVPEETMHRGRSKITAKTATSLKVDRKLRDEFGDTIVDEKNDKEVELMLEMDAAKPGSLV